MESHHNRSFGSYWVGALILIIGALFLLQNFGGPKFGEIVAEWWPLIIIIIGLDRFRRGDRPGGTIILIVGVVFLIGTLNLFGWGIFKIWPIILILIGLSILLKGRGRPGWWSVASGETSDDFLKIRSTFSGVSRTVLSEDFKGGEIAAVFGGVELDLRNAKVSGEGCRLELSAQFGAVELIVPNEWRISVSGSPVLGAIEDKTSKSGEKSAQVECSCTVAFGAVEIHN